LSLRELLKKMVDGAPLSPEEIRGGFEALLLEETRDSEIALFLTSLSRRGLDADALTEGARVLRERCTRVELAGLSAIDTCGTGGDRSGSFNFSTAAGLLASACGVPVAKHGNRALTSKSGSADLLEALGIPIEGSPAQVADRVRERQFGFMLAPEFHPATRRVQSVRKKLDMVTVFNFLGPLVNPAFVRRQVVGVFAPGMRPIMAEALRRLGAEKAWVLSSEDGLDEMSLGGRTWITEVTPSGLRELEISPEDAGLEKVELDFLLGGSAAENAQVLESIFSGAEQGPILDGILLNTASALLVADRAKDLLSGVAQAREAIASGAARNKLEQLKGFDR